MDGVMDIKPRPNHRLYLQILRRMTPEQRLKKAFELSELSRGLFIQGLKERFPGLSEAELRELIKDRLERCHNQNY